MEKIFDIAKDSEQKWGVIAQGIDGNFEKLEQQIGDLSTKVNGESFVLGKLEEVRLATTAIESYELMDVYYLKVIEGNKYNFKVTSSEKNTIRTAYADNVYIGNIITNYAVVNGIVGDTVISISATIGGYYMINVMKSAVTSVICTNDANGIDDKLEELKSEMKEANENLQDEIDNIGSNIGDGSIPFEKINGVQLCGNLTSLGNLTSGHYYRNINGEMVEFTNQSSYYALLMPVKKDTTYYFTYGRFVILLGSDAITPIDSIDRQKLESINSSTASYIMVSFSPSGYKVEDYIFSPNKLDNTPPKYIVDKLGANADELLVDAIAGIKMTNPLYGKKYIACGDSYTAWSDALYATGKYSGTNVVYAKEIVLRNSMSSDFTKDFAESGSTMALAKSSEESKPTVDAKAFSNAKYLLIPTDTDYLTIAFGINDTSLCELGSLEDTENTTFYGAWNKVLTYFATNMPSMKIGIIIFQRSDNEYYHAVKEIAQYYGIPYLDFYGGTDTPMYVDGKAFSVDPTMKQKKHDYYCGQEHTSDGTIVYKGITYIVKQQQANTTHPGLRAHIDESTIIEHFLKSL